MKCSVERCPRDVSVRGLCPMHYQRMRKTGSLGNDDPTVMRYERIPEWVEQNIPTNSNQCLTWPFQRTKSGYAVWSGHGASRRILRITKGPPPSKSHQAAHSCGNGHLACVNPNHLRWATPAENMSDKYVHGTIRYGEENGVSKITEAQVREIRKMRRNGSTYQAIADKIGRSVGCVRGVTSGANWAWLPEA